MLKNKFVFFLNKLKIKNLNIFTVSVLFFKFSNFIVLNFANFTKDQKFYIFNLIYNYQLNYIFLNNINFLKKKLIVNFNKMFMFHTQNLKKFLFFLRELFIVKNNLLGVNYLKKKNYKKNDQVKINKNEYINKYKISKKIYYNRYLVTKNKLINDQNKSIEYYFDELLWPEYEFEEKYFYTNSKKNFNILLIKIKNNFLLYSFFKKIVFFKNKLNFIDNFKHIFFFYLIYFFNNYFMLVYLLNNFVLFYFVILQKIFNVKY